MSKFAKKTTSEKKEKIWTNDPELQDQDTGETTAAGKAHRKKVEERTGVKQAQSSVIEMKKTKKAPKGESKPSKKETAAKSSSDDRKITLVTKENPKRKGTAAFSRFELYKKAKTAQQFIDAGGTSSDLRFDEKAGHIKLS